MITDGQILYGLIKSTDTSLIEGDGTVNHSWSSSYLPGVMARWLGDGNILRAIRVSIGPGGVGGGIQKVLWNGTVVWDFRYNINGHLSHHDFRPLPNGNVLMIAWETKTPEEAIAAGRNPNYVSDQGFMPDHIIEVKPTGPTSGDIVWEWHAWDHLIQDYDSSKENYGIVANHPELIDINYIASPVIDWMHTNSIDYNKEFDQILLSVCYFSEIWIIDHSTTTEEAAGHKGGNSGKGGDLLYRWGNPQVYDMGNSSDQKFFMQHDATWIDDEYPGEGHILVFNNGQTRPGIPYSSVDEIIPPVDGNGEYYLLPGTAYGPLEPTWLYTADPPTSFYAYFISGAQRLPSGNTLICDGVIGRFFEVTPEGETVWQYNAGNQVFKVDYIPPGETEPPESGVADLDCSGSLSWTDIEPGATVNGSFQVRNIGDANSWLNWTIDTASISWGTWTFTPESGENLYPENGPMTVQVSVIVPNEGNSVFLENIRVENQDNSSDYDLISVFLKTPINDSIENGMTLYRFFMIKMHLFSQEIHTIFDAMIWN